MPLYRPTARVRYVACACGFALLVHALSRARSSARDGGGAPDGVDAAALAARLDLIAVGVNTGGANAAARVDALRRGWLRHFPRHVVMGDRADPSRGIRAPPSRFYCSSRARTGALDGGDAWRSRGRCTQLRFLYLVLALRDEAPDAEYYALLDDDSFVDAAGLAAHLAAHARTRLAPSEPWLLGPEAPFNTDVFLVGERLFCTDRYVANGRLFELAAVSEQPQVGTEFVRGLRDA